ncbi:MAG TPA: hypothetical protein VGP72_08360 [Planctomycetota bacterium]|jgi:hypothetical protein
MNTRVLIFALAAVLLGASLSASERLSGRAFDRRPSATRDDSSPTDNVRRSRQPKHIAAKHAKPADLPIVHHDKPVDRPVDRPFDRPTDWTRDDGYRPFDEPWLVPGTVIQINNDAPVVPINPPAANPPGDTVAPPTSNTPVTPATPTTPGETVAPPTSNTPATPEEPHRPSQTDPLPADLAHYPNLSPSKAYVLAYYADTDGCGHGFIKVRPYETPGAWTGFGYYGRRDKRGIFNDTHHMWNSKVCYKINEDQLKKILDLNAEWNGKKYDWWKCNCVSFVRAVDKAVGTDLFSFWDKVDVPDVLDKDICGYSEHIVNPGGTTSTAEVQETDAQIIKTYYTPSANSTPTAGVAPATSGSGVAPATSGSSGGSSSGSSSGSNTAPATKGSSSSFDFGSGSCGSK